MLRLVMLTILTVALFLCDFVIASDLGVSNEQITRELQEHSSKLLSLQDKTDLLVNISIFALSTGLAFLLVLTGLNYLFNIRLNESQLQKLKAEMSMLQDEKIRSESDRQAESITNKMNAEIEKLKASTNKSVADATVLLAKKIDEVEEDAAKARLDATEVQLDLYIDKEYWGAAFVTLMRLFRGALDIKEQFYIEWGIKDLERILKEADERTLETLNDEARTDYLAVLTTIYSDHLSLLEEAKDAKTWIESVLKNQDK